MELRQLRYFVSAVDLGGMGRAAAALGVVTSALSQQISRLEGELATRLLQRTTSGVLPTDAGLAFYRQAQLTLRHADDAIRAAQQARLAGHVSVGLPPSTASVLGLPFLQAMRDRYPEVRLRLVESLSGNLATLLTGRQLELAVLFETASERRWSLSALADERLFIIGARRLAGMPKAKRIRLAQLTPLPVILPSGSHGLRAIVDAAFARARYEPSRIIEIDGLSLLMDAVGAGLGITIQPGAATARLPRDEIGVVEIADRGVIRRNVLASLSDDEMTPAALAARVVLLDVTRSLIAGKAWPGARLHDL